MENPSNNIEQTINLKKNLKKYVKIKKKKRRSDIRITRNIILRTTEIYT